MDSNKENLNDNIGNPVDNEKDSSAEVNSGIFEERASAEKDKLSEVDSSVSGTLSECDPTQPVEISGEDELSAESETQNNTDSQSVEQDKSKYMSGYENSKEMGERMKEIFLSVLAGLIGSLAGSLPLLIEIFISSKTSHVLFMIIPFAITFFMVTFKSWRGRGAIVIILLFSVAGVFFVNSVLFNYVNTFESIWDAFLSESAYSYIFLVTASIIGYECLTSDKINPPKQKI
jgi:hypothetical protein